MSNDNQLNYGKPFDINEWKRLCKDAYDRLKHTRSEFQFMEALSQIDKMRSTLFTIARVACKKCGGTGEYSYPDTATWHRGLGGQSITEDVCDKCWGTGRNDKIGLNLRKERDWGQREWEQHLSECSGFSLHKESKK